MDPSSIEYFTSKLETFRNVDREREELITEVLRKYDGLLTEYKRKCDDYENEMESRRMWQQKELLARNEVKESRYARDKFLKAGADGGAEAAEQLHARVRKHIATLYPDDNTQDWSIVVHVILNVEGLSKALKSCGIIRSVADLQAFGRTFASTQPLFSFIDVGYGKEQADHKIRETLRFMIRLGQCKHVFFGPCHDNGYLPVLEEYKHNSSFASRFSLISGTAPEPGFRQLGFAIDKYDDIFRTTNLVPSSAPTSPPSGISSPRSNTPMPAPVTSIPSGSYANVGTRANTMTISLGSKKPATSQRKYYLKNAYDERIDPDLPRADPAAEQRYSDRVQKLGRNYCNKYHLLDSCPNGSYCGYEHGERLPPSELGVLRLKCRSLKCTDTYFCERVDCPFSHHCRLGNKCTSGSCRWADTHHVDLRPSVRVYEDGSRVPIATK